MSPTNGSNRFHAVCLALFAVILFSDLKLSGVDALKCKCTQSSHKTPCLDGICETPTGSSACLMLDHPISGRHYACSTAKLTEGECIEKNTKSGALVSVCPCDSSDYCNYKLWPAKSNDYDDPEDYTSFGSARANSGSASRRQVPTSSNNNNHDDTVNSAPLVTTQITLLLIAQFLVSLFVLN